MGCSFLGQNTYDDIIGRPSSRWTDDDCRTIIASAMQNNRFCQSSNVVVFATPYYPSIINAINRYSQHINHWSEEEYRSAMDDIAKDRLGMYIDWEQGRFVDSRGNYFKDKLQIDSLTFLVSLKNQGWPFPDIMNLEDQIYLLNNKNKFIKPKYVWGKRGSSLFDKETVLVMFQLRNGEYHFLEGCNMMYLVIKGLGEDITFPFSPSMMR
ncbi:MAG: hypothetical protein HY277_05665 [Ignavibacteriales bacterium]|nr:hypothetical protein [Ignavibacteriales bacterium]